MKNIFNPTFKEEYELALKTGKRKFGQECRHEEIKNGKCLNCLRRVINQRVA